MPLLLVLAFCAASIATVLAVTAKHISPLLRVCICMSTAMWYLCPALTAFALNVWYGRGDKGSDSFCSVGSMETAVLLTSLLLVLFIKPPMAFKSLTAAPWESTVATGSTVLIGGTVIAIIASFLQPSAPISYLNNNALAMTADLSQQATTPVTFLLQLMPCVCYAILFTPWAKSRQATWLRVGAVACLSWFAWTAIMSGSRIFLATPIILTALAAKQYNWSLKRALAIGATMGIATATLGAALLVVVGSQRGRGELVQEQVITGVYAHMTGETLEDRSRQLLVELDQKFDSFTAGDVLLDQEGIATAGIRPYWGALAALIPRVFWETKPVPLSVDAGYGGTPARLAARLMGYDPRTGNVGVSPAAIAVWHFGYLNLPVMCFTNLLWWWLLSALLLSPSVLKKSIGFMGISVPALATIFVPPDVFLMQSQRAVAFCVLIWIIDKVFFRATHRRKACLTRGLSLAQAQR